MICAEGPFDIKPGAASADAAFGQSDISIKCNNPAAAWLLLGAAAAAGVTAGVVAGGDDPQVSVTPTVVSGAQ